MTKLISGRVPKIPSANVRADRYEFLEISEAEPDLGLPPNSGYVLTSNIQGVRSWVNSVEFSGVANVSLYTNLANISLSANVANTVLSLSNFSTANLTEGINLYFTNVRVISAITPLLTTSNVIEGTNQYFTNARTLIGITTGTVQGNIIVTDTISSDKLVSNTITIGAGSGGSITGANLISATYIQSTNWLGLYTSNVIEGTNLYYTDARVLANVEQMSVNVFADVDITGILNNGVLVWNGTKFVAGTIDTGATSNLALFAEVANTVLTLNNFTTANLAEGTNLYFTNARSVGSLIAGQNITIEANGRISANLTATLANITTVIDNLTTDGIAEGAVNLYYTNSRVRSTLSGGTGVIYDPSSGSISIGQNVSTEASVVFKNLTLNGNLYVLGNLVSVFANTLTISDPIIQIGYGNPGDSYNLGLVGNYNDGVERHTGLIRDHNDGKFKLFDNLIIEPDLVNVDTSNVTFRYASLVVSTLEGNVTGTVGTLSNFTTANLKESTSNLYYTNDRVVTAVIPLLTTSNVIEGSNLYFTVERVNATVQPFLTTANVVETSGNLYFTNTRVVSALVAGDQIIIEANGRISANVAATPLDAAAVNAIVQPFLTTANVTETSANLYFTNARVVSALVAGDSITIEANGRISANISASSVAAQVSTLSNFTTNDLAEGANALYYTNARARTAYTAGQGIAITQAGVISFKQADPGLGFYNSGLTLASAGIVSNIYSNVVMFSSENGVNFIVQSLHITNLSSNTAYVNGRIGYSDGNDVVFANLFELPGSSSTEMFLKPAVFKPSDSIQLQSFSNPKQPANNLISAMVSYQGSAITEFDRAYAVLNSNSTSNVFVSSGKNSIIESIKVHNPNPTPAGITTQIVTDTNQIFAFLSSNLIVPAFSTVEICEYPKTLLTDYTIRMQKSPSFAQPLTAFISAKYTSFFTATPSLSTIGEVAGANVVTIDFQTLGVTNGTTFYYSTDGNVNASDFVPAANTGSFTVTNDQGIISLQLASDTGFEGEERFRVQIRRASVTGTVIASTSNIIIKDTGNTEYVLVSPAVNTPQNEGNTITFNVTVFNPTSNTYYYTTKNLEGNVFAPRFSSANTGAFVIAGSGQSNTVSLVANADGITNGDGIFQLEIRSGSTTGTIANTSSNVTIVDTSQFGLLAIGGDFVETVDDYKRHVFLSSNTFTVNNMGGGNNQIQLLVVAGGGGGLGNSPLTNGYGGGGAGGLLISTADLTTVGNYTITIGGGGSATAPTTTPGNRSEFKNQSNTINISTMGGGAAGNAVPGQSGGGGKPGGSGGGGGKFNVGGGGFNYPGPAQQGYPGNSTQTPSEFGGGGGGAGGLSVLYSGGIGSVIPFSPASYGTGGPAPGRYFAGGGAGNGPGSVGGAGGGGNISTPGTVNTGGGGGGDGAGGSGIIIITYRIR
jgi:hypothetical protein